jgi:putative ATPase
MDTLFSDIERYKRNANAPLAVRMRPQTLEGFVGQEAAVGEGSWLRNAIEHDVLSSVILYGPAGTGKTTLARIIANTTHAEFVEVSAVTGTVKDLRREVDAAEQRLLVGGRRTILFVDEIHRFNRSQQDALPPCRRGPYRGPGGCHHREPLLRGQLRPALALPRGRAHGPGR